MVRSSSRRREGKGMRRGEETDEERGRETHHNTHPSMRRGGEKSKGMKEGETQKGNASRNGFKVFGCNGSSTVIVVPMMLIAPHGVPS